MKYFMPLLNRFLLPLIALVVSFFCYTYYSSQFHVTKISEALPPKDSLEASLITPDIKTIFNKPLAYLGEGNQAYAFETSDGKYVVKFFKNAPLSTQSRFENLSFLPFVESYLAKNKGRGMRKFDRVFKAYDVAYCYDKEHCGLTYIHLHHSSDINMTAKAFDASGVPHRVDLDSHAFVVQKKGVPLKTLLKKEIDDGNIELVKVQLQKVIEMYLEEYQNGILDDDHNLMTNIGFVEERPIRIDVGKLAHDPLYSSHDVYLADLDKVINERIAKWLSRHAPDHKEEIMQSLLPYLDQPPATHHQSIESGKNSLTSSW